MQLDAPEKPRAISARLRAATCLLLTTVAPRLAHAADAPPAPSPSPTPTSQIDVTGLFYSERIRVLEPTIRYTRSYFGGRSFFGQLSVDSVTGASPNGTLPTGQTQTITSASGRSRTLSADSIPTQEFNDTRIAVDAGFRLPVKMAAFSLGGHYSHEQDYRSLGLTGDVSIDFNHKLTTLNLGAGYNDDQVSPVGGTPVGMAPPGAFTDATSNPKKVKTGLVGVSQVLSRRWLLGISTSLATEDGYLTDPYKVLSVIDARTGVPVSEIAERRPDRRERKSVQADSVYHFESNILYLSYRRYWDDWGIGSHTIDARYRLPRGTLEFIEPHLRFYSQSAADFYRFGLVEGEALPQYATSDYRMNSFKSITLGATVGFAPGGRRATSEWTVRAEYIGQFGNGSPPGTVGVQTRMDLFPAVNVFSLVVNYRFNR
jgi:hypothetical protein